MQQGKAFVNISNGMEIQNPISRWRTGINPTIAQKPLLMEKLPFENGGLVNRNRDFYGGTILYRSSSDSRYGVKGIIGLDFQNQRDHRDDMSIFLGAKGIRQ